MSSRITPVGPAPLIGALIRVPLEAVRARILTALHAAGYEDIATAHFNVLVRFPGPENQRPSDLAAAIPMSRQSMNYLLGQLEQLGYLTREDDPEDARSKRIQMTARGDAARATIRSTIRDLELEWQGELGPEGYAQLCALLARLQSSQVVREFRGEAP